MTNTFNSQDINDPSYFDTLFNANDHKTAFHILNLANEAYYNSDEPLMSDACYDVVTRKAKTLYPTHKFFVGVGSLVRGDSVTLPIPMGSLNQQFELETERWVKDNNLLNQSFIVTDKEDGVSCLLLYNDGKLTVAYSRGNGIEGQDITRHIKHCNVPTKISTHILIVRAEIIISKDNFPILQDTVTTSGNKTFANARNAVAGLMNRKEVLDNKKAYKLLDLVAYEVIDTSDTISKQTQLEILKHEKFITPTWSKWVGRDLNDHNMVKYLEDRKNESPYEIDGIVVDVDNADYRDELNTDSSLNPDYSFKYKTLSSDNYAETTVTKVELRVSKHGYIKPRIHIEPVNLVGVTIKHTTGFNMSFVHEHKLGPGSVVGITRQGDVIPHLSKVISPMPDVDYSIWFNSQLDEIGNWEWNETQVDAVLTETDSNSMIDIKSMVDMFDSLDVAYLGMGNVTKLYEGGLTSPEDIITSKLDTLVNIVGANGKKIHNSLVSRLTDIPLYKLVGAHSTQRGIGIRKIKKLETALGPHFLENCSINRFEVVDGYDTKTAEAACTAIEEFKPFFEHIKDHVTIQQEQSVGGVFDNMKICFTGFRDKELQMLTEQQGGTIQSGVSSKTDMVVTTDPNGNSSKLKKARNAEPPIQIISVDAFKSMIPS